MLTPASHPAPPARPAPSAASAASGLAQRALVMVALAAGLAACGPPPKDPALEGYERFLGAVRTGNAPEVWHRLTPASQKALALRVGEPGTVPRPADAARQTWAHQAEALGLPRAESSLSEPLLAVLGVRPGWQFELDLPQSAALETSTLADDRRVVVGPLGGARWRIPMLRVEGDWRVDLFAATPAAP